MRTNSEILHAFATEFDGPGHEYATAADSLSERFRKIRSAYDHHQRMVDAGVRNWMQGDVYALADWIGLFSPIEYDAWCEIRGVGVPLWPQLPVGRFFVDFGNPVAKVALECDGKEFHDPIKDHERDVTLREMGWRVFRVTGAECYRTRVMDDPSKFFGTDEYDDYLEEHNAKTITPLIRQIRDIVREHMQ